jgi:hypothetical protein
VALVLPNYKKRKYRRWPSRGLNANLWTRFFNFIIVGGENRSMGSSYLYLFTNMPSPTHKVTCPTFVAPRNKRRKVSLSRTLFFLSFPKTSKKTSLSLS